jgi:hypothetical protein
MENGARCVACTTAECEIGFYRGQCGSSRDAECETCTVQPLNSFFVSSGHPWNVDNCAYECLPGFLLSNYPEHGCMQTEVSTFLPSVGHLYGNAHMVIQVNFLSSEVSCENIFVRLSRNVSCVSMSRMWKEGVGLVSEITVNIPNSESPLVFTPTIYILNFKGLEILNFPSRFEYLPSLPASVVDVTPSTASIFTGTSVRVSVLNFPVIQSTTELRVDFIWSTDNCVSSIRANATVLKVAKTKTSPTNGPQNWHIDVLTPFGSHVVEGIVSLQVVHVQYPHHGVICSQSAFTFIDPLLPRVFRMESDDSVSENVLRVRQSERTQFKVFVEKVPASVGTNEYGALIGASPVQIEFVSTNTVARTAQIVLTAPASPTTNLSKGMMVFGSLPDGCSTSCCSDMSCKASCSDIKVACFTLDYFDDKLPIVTFLSDLTGPEIGMDIIKMRIINFPLMNSAADAYVHFGDDNETRAGTLVLSQQSSEETILLIVTPEFPLSNEEAMKSVAVKLVPKSRPQDRTVAFAYTYEAVLPKIISVIPTSGPSDGGSTVLVSIDYFPYPPEGGINVNFNGYALNGSSIEILGLSDKLNTLISFKSPSSTPGPAVVRTAPGGCKDPCKHAVYFSFLQVDSTVPVLMTPIPSGGCLSAASVSGLRLEKFPDQVDGVDAVFASEQAAYNVSVDPNVLKTEGDVTHLSSLPVPAGILPGQYSISLKVRQNVIEKIVSFTYLIYDCTLPRIISVAPEIVPNVISFNGRKLLLKTKVTLIISNFLPQISDVSVTIGSEPAEITMVKGLGACSLTETDCNRTMIDFMSPALESPGVKDAYVSSSLLETTLQFTLEYVSPCDFASFCQELNLVFDYHALLANPSIVCQIRYCLDTAQVGEPVIVSWSPGEGFTDGGTLVDVMVQNLPVFFVEDLSAKVAFGSSVMFAQVEDLHQMEDSTLTSGTAYVKLRTPAVPVDTSFATITISARVFNMVKSVSFPFEYLPVITGPASVLDYQPRQIYRTESLALYVKIGNVYRLDQPYNTSKILVKLANHVAIPATEIVSSDRFCTAIRLAVPLPVGGQWSQATQLEFALFHADRGLQNAAGFSVLIREVPAPTVTSYHPSFGIASEVNIVRLVIAYLPTAAQRKSATASLDFTPTGTIANASVLESGYEYNGTVTLLRPLFAQCPNENCCDKPHCSLFEARVEVKPLSAIDSEFGGPGVITFVVDGAEPLNVTFNFIAVGAPMISAVDPKNQVNFYPFT